MNGPATVVWYPRRLIDISLHVDFFLAVYKLRLDLGSCLPYHSKRKLSMPVRLFRLVHSYQFGWLLGVAIEFLIRSGLGNDVANGFEDAICSNRGEQSSVG
jgi:hypothetical protein